MHPLDKFLGSVPPPAPQFRRGTGPDALPQGAASNLARAGQASRAAVASQSPTPASGSTPAPNGPQNGSQGPGMAPQPVQPFRPQTDEEKYLFGPTERPNEPLMSGFQNSMAVPPPPDLAQHLPALQAVANRPDAPPQLRLLLDLISHQIAMNGG